MYDNMNVSISAIFSAYDDDINYFKINTCVCVCV